VKEAWQVVALGKMNYAEAIKSVVGKPTEVKSNPDSACALGGRPDSTARSGRADVIEATVAKPAKKQWKLKSQTCSTACQTDPEPVEAVTQTSMDCATQTEALPEEKAIQTSTDAEMQTSEEEENFDDDDKFVIAAMHDMITMISRHTSRRMMNDGVYKEVFQRFDQDAITIMKEHQYWENYEAANSSEHDEAAD
jgi:hypothetical protein